jgi:hypothetical protein
MMMGTKQSPATPPWWPHMGSELKVCLKIIALMFAVDPSSFFVLAGIN